MVFYAVKYGRNPGIYKTWNECDENTKEFVGAFYKKFNTEIEAKNFIEDLESNKKSQFKNINSKETIQKKLPIESIHLVDSTYDFDSSINIYFNSIYIGSNGEMNSIGSICIYFGPDDKRNEIRKITINKYKNLSNDIVLFKSVLIGLNKVITEIVDKKNIVLHTNSLECIKGITSDLEINKNLPSYELIEKIHILIKKYSNIKFFYNKKTYSTEWIHDNKLFECKRLNFENLKDYYDKIVFIFGKFKNITFENIFNKNPDYFDWCISNCKLQINEILLFLESKND